MAGTHRITINGESFVARRGELLLDAALNNGIDLPYDCRAGHCGTCCVRLVSGKVQGGDVSSAGVIHACQCRIAGDTVIERSELPAVRDVAGVLSSLRRVSSNVFEVGIRTERAFPYLPGQYAQVRFGGYPSRPYSITHPLGPQTSEREIWFHVRQIKDGRVSSALGHRIKRGHRVSLSGPFGSAYFRPNLKGRLVLVGTSTGFAPIWSIAAAALREKPDRRLMLIAGGSNIESLYMGPALVRLSRFPNVLIVPVCSAPQTLSKAVMQGRPTDYLPTLLPSDVLYACGAQGMVDAIKSVAAQAGAVCYADPFIPTVDEGIGQSLMKRAKGWLAPPNGREMRPQSANRGRSARQQSGQNHETSEPRVGGRCEPRMA